MSKIDPHLSAEAAAVIGQPSENVRQIFDVSTGHLRPSTREMIDRGDFKLSRFPHPQGYGWFVWVPDDVDLWIAECEESDAPLADDLTALLRLARAHNCDYALVDADGPSAVGLLWYGDGEV